MAWARWDIQWWLFMHQVCDCQKTRPAHVPCCQYSCYDALRGLFRKHTVKMWMGSSQAATEALLHTIRQMPQLWELLTKYLDLSCVVLDKLWLMPISWLAVVLFRFIFPEASLAFKCAIYSKIQRKLDPGGFFNAYLGYPASISNSENTGIYVLSI